MDVRPIDANALLDIAKNKYHDIVAGRYPFNIVVYDLVQIIEEQPTLDLAPVVHGYWKHEEPVKDDGQKPFVCSTCGLRHPRYGTVDKAYFSYCPWCGTPMDAEMDGGEEG